MNLKNLFAKRRRLLLLLTTCSILTLMLCSLNFKSQTIFSLKDFKSSARLWFLTNGTRLSLPPPLATQRLALWPEDSKSDRIVNQLVFRPLLSTNQTPKKIFLKTSDGDHDWPIKMGGHEFRECPVSTCEFVGREESSLADLIFFKPGFESSLHDSHVTQRPPHQLWAQFQIESPAHSSMQAPPDHINWTVTYRRDSEVVTPYFKFFFFEREVDVEVRVRNKTRQVAWMVSNCKASNRRLEYARELAKHIGVDIFGSCGQLRCARDDDTCWRMLRDDYKFYLSFENSNCLEYISEKFWTNALGNHVVPVVMGAHPSHYAQVAPPHSFIHVDHFHSPRALAQYLLRLDRNPEEYSRFFAWKRLGEVKQIFMWCRVCALLHAPPRPPKTYHDLNAWWKAATCVKDTWR